jgi:PAS domain S-box-containing protein
MPFTPPAKVARVLAGLRARVRAQWINVLSDDRFELMADRSPVMTWVSNAAGRVRFANRAYQQFFGRTAEEVRTEPSQPLVHPDDRQGYVDVFFKALRAHSSFDCRVRVRRADGDWRWIHSYGTPYFSPSAEFEGIVASSLDVTAEVEAEIARRESEDFYRGLADSVPVVIWMCDLHGACTFMNKGWERATGQSVKNASGNGWISAVHPEDRREISEVFHHALANKAPYRYEYRLQSPDGGYRVLLAAAAPRTDKRGDFRGYIGSMLDITERKRYEEALRRADEQKDVFLAVLAHELRNPLGSIANATQVLRLKDLPPDARSAATIVARQVVQLSRLVDDLLDIGRLAHGKIVLHPEELTIQDVVRAAVECIQARIDSQGHQLTIEMPSAPVELTGDFTRLTQILVNLLSNAAKYSRRGGHIRVRVVPATSDVKVSVEDRGIGIPSELLSHVFDMFAQAQPLSNRTDGGLGIGLALAKRLAELHHGTLEARSEGTGKGSQFVLQLPRHDGHDSATVANVEVNEEEAQPRLRILVVDDNADSAQSLSMLLRDKGHEVHAANDGATALELVRTLRPQVVILDIAMPDMSGHEVSQKLRKEAWGRDVCLVAYTGFGQSEDRVRSQQAGFDFHLTKPADMAELNRILANLHSPEIGASAHHARREDRDRDGLSGAGCF